MSDWKPQSTDHFRRLGTSIDYEAGYHAGFSEGSELGIKAVIGRLNSLMGSGTINNKDAFRFIAHELWLDFLSEAGLDD